MKVQRFFHIRIGGQRNGGATVLVTGDTESIGRVLVQTAFCSKKDNYCRKTGREVAKQALEIPVALRDLSRYLSDIEQGILVKQDNWFRKHPDDVKYVSRDYSFAVRYFLPRV